MFTNKPSLSRHQILCFALFWAGVIALMWGLDLATKFNEKARLNAGPEDFKLWAEQITSAIGVYAMIPIIALWLSTFDVLKKTTLLNLLMLAVGSFLFSSGHWALMMLQRAFIYPLFDRTFNIGNIGHNLLFEYQKDIKIYVAICCIILSWRFWRATRDTATVDGAKDVSTEEIVQHNKLLVHSGTSETFIKVADILCIKSDRNYVTLTTSEGEFLLRQTLTSLADRLPHKHFVRVHRSYLVNLDQSHKITKNLHGQSIIEFDTGVSVPVSKTYASGLRNLGQL